MTELLAAAAQEGATTAGQLWPVVPWAGGFTAVLGLMTYLLKRGERKDESAYDKVLAMFNEVKNQRDDYRTDLELTRKDLKTERAERRRVQVELERCLRRKGIPASELGKEPS